MITPDSLHEPGKDFDTLHAPCPRCGAKATVRVDTDGHGRLVETVDCRPCRGGPRVRPLPHVRRTAKRSYATSPKRLAGKGAIAAMVEMLGSEPDLTSTEMYARLVRQGYWLKMKPKSFSIYATEARKIVRENR